MIKLILLGFLVTIISFLCAMISIKCKQEAKSEDKQGFDHYIYNGFIIALMSLGFSLFKIESFQNQEVNHLNYENQILSSENNMSEIFFASRSNFLFPYSDIHIINDEKNIKPLDTDHDAVIGIDVDKENDKNSLVAVTYLTQKECTKKECHYEWHKNMALIPRNEIHALKHNIFLIPYDFNNYDSMVLSNAKSNTAIVDINKDIKDLKALIK